MVDNITETDVLVVGGGPAGSSAAVTAVQLGLKSIVIDKRKFPRDKLCGGLVTPRSKKLFEEIFKTNLANKLIHSSDRISFYSDNNHLADINSYCNLHFSMRYDFDNFLLRLAESSGASLILGDGLEKLNEATNQVTLESGNIIKYKILIGADGVNSSVAKLLFGQSFDESTIGFGLEVEVPKEVLPEQNNSVEIDFGAAKWGYGWVFPKKKTFTIGVGGLHKINPNMKQLLENYLKAKGLNINDFKIKGQYIPFGDYRLRPGRGNVLLCGDAAGVVDPITGEGIAYALETGQFASTAALQAIERGQYVDAYDCYRDLYGSVISPIRQANIWRWVIFPSIMRRPFSWAFKDAGTLQRGYLDILSGKHGYGKLYYLFAIQALKAIRKIFVKAFRKMGFDRGSVK